jgi:hypothetical protein
MADFKQSQLRDEYTRKGKKRRNNLLSSFISYLDSSEVINFRSWIKTLALAWSSSQNSKFQVASRAGINTCHLRDVSRAYVEKGVILVVSKEFDTSSEILNQKFVGVSFNEHTELTETCKMEFPTMWNRKLDREHIQRSKVSSSCLVYRIDT